MEDTAIDQIISDGMAADIASAKPTNTPALKTVPAPEAPNEQKPEANENADQEEGSAEDNTPWPKKAVNAMSRRDKQLNKLRAERAERDAQYNDPKFLEQKLTELKSKQAPGAAPINPSDPEPELGKYDDWNKYQRDMTAWLVRNAMAQNGQKQEQATNTHQQEAWIAERAAAVNKQASELVTKNPHYLEIMQANADILDGFPKDVQQAFLKVDNATLGAVVLSNEGTLEDLAEMPPSLVEKVLKRAVMRGMASLKSEGIEGSEDQAGNNSKPEKTVSAAPTPIKAAKTASQSGAKSADRMNDDEFRKEFLA